MLYLKNINEMFEDSKRRLVHKIYKYIWNNNGRLSHTDIMIKYKIGFKETINILEDLTTKKLIYKLGNTYSVISTRNWKKQ